MNTIYKYLFQQLQQGEKAVLAVIAQRSGSTPRGPGAAMAAFQDGRFFGSVGGGAIEHKAQELCRQCLQSEQSFLRDFNLSAQKQADLGMVCGGQATLLFQYFDGQDPSVQGLAACALEIADANQTVWFAAQTGTWNTWLYTENRLPAAQTTDTKFPSDQLGKIFTLQPTWTQNAQEFIFAQPITGQPKAFIFGGGHIAQALVPLLSQVSFDCTVIDDREAFTNKERFPHAQQTIVSDMEQAFDLFTITEQDYVVIMTRGHIHDYQVLENALKTPAKYIGMMGSHTKVDATFTRLIHEGGFSYQDTQRVHTPIGIAIGGETPEEVAISIAAEMIGVRSGQWVPPEH